MTLQITKSQLAAMRNSGTDTDTSCPQISKMSCTVCGELFKGLQKNNDKIKLEHINGKDAVTGCFCVWLTKAKINRRLDSLIKHGTIVIKD